MQKRILVLGAGFLGAAITGLWSMTVTLYRFSLGRPRALLPRNNSTVRIWWSRMSASWRFWPG